MAGSRPEMEMEQVQVQQQEIVPWQEFTADGKLRICKRCRCEFKDIYEDSKRRNGYVYCLDCRGDMVVEHPAWDTVARQNRSPGLRLLDAEAMGFYDN